MKLKTKTGAMSRSAFAPKRKKQVEFLLEVIEATSMKKLKAFFDKQLKTN
jgi:hypothetical protein